MKKLFVCRGLPGCGKSTWAKILVDQSKFAIRRVNKDDLRSMIDNNNWDGNKSESFILSCRDAIIENALLAGFSVVNDDTNFHPKHEARLKELADKHGAELEVVDFSGVSPEICVRRDKKRAKPVTAKVIWSMYNQFIKDKDISAIPMPIVNGVPANIDFAEPVEYKVQAPVYDLTLPDAVTVDMDGTLSKMVDRGPFDFSKCGNDELNVPVAITVRSMKERGMQVLIVSGRDDSCEKETREWLNKHSIGYNAIWMRKTGDKRKDSIVKEEIYRTNIEVKYNIIFCLDDRDQVVELWRKKLGLTCFQVNYGNF
jgi:predicted kinase